MSFIQKSVQIQSASEDASLTISAPGSGKYNCLTQLVVETSAAGDFTITSSGATTFKAAIGAGGGLTLDWRDSSPWRGGENASIVVAMGGGGNYTINARGFVHP